MKRVLLTFLVALLATVMYAQVDTVYVKPGDPISFELKVDTVKYPALKGNQDKVKWFHGDSEITPKEFSGKQFVDKQKAETTDSGNYYYAFKVDITTRTGTELTKDTVKFVHVYEKPVISKFLLNGKLDDEVYEGDTVEVEIEVENPLNVTEVVLLNGEDSIYVGKDLKFNFVPFKEGTSEYSISVLNPSYKNDALSKKRTLTVVPAIKLDNLSCFAQTGSDSYTKTTTENSMNISVLNHDSINLVVNSNVSNILKIKDNAKVTFTWSKQGVVLPKGIEAKGDSLIISEYDKLTMDGIYNCIVSDGQTVFTATFIVKSEFPASNSSTISENIVIYSKDKVLSIKGAEGKQVIVSTISGMVVYNKKITSNLETLDVPQGVLLISVGNKSYKVISK